MEHAGAIVRQDDSVHFEIANYPIVEIKSTLFQFLAEKFKSCYETNMAQLLGTPSKRDLKLSRVNIFNTFPTTGPYLCINFET